MQEAGTGRSPAASLVRSTAAKLGRLDRQGLTIALAYPVVVAMGVVLAANLIGDVIETAFGVRKDIVATFAVVSGVLFFGWSGEAVVRWILTHLRRDLPFGAARENG